MAFGSIWLAKYKNDLYCGLGLYLLNTSVLWGYVVKTTTKSFGRMLWRKVNFWLTL